MLMAIETERKFLLRSEAWRDHVASVTPMRQGYIAAATDRSVRVRIAGPKAWITAKFGGAGLTREEYEYAIPVPDAEAMLAHVESEVIKDRHLVPWGGVVFEIDVFHGRLTGLILAELEIEPGFSPAALPDWLGGEVTGDPRYYNAVLVRDGLPTN